MDCYFNLLLYVVLWKGELYCNNGVNFGSIFNVFFFVFFKSLCNFFLVGKEYEVGSDRKYKVLFNWLGFWDWFIVDLGNDVEMEYIVSVFSVLVYEWIYE